jgi:hypothetical protein
MSTITREQVRAIKKADFAVFEHYTDRQGTERIAIRVGCNSNYKEPWREWQVEIPVVSSKYDLYDRGTPYDFGYKYQPKSASYYTSIYWESDRDNPLLTTLASLRAGDELHFLWQFSPGNGYLEGARSTVQDDKTGAFVCNGARLYYSELTLVVIRGKSKKRLAFHIGTQVGPQNSAAMIKL